MKALILGTGMAQLDAIEYLQSNKWYVIGCSYVRNRGSKIVDQFELIDIKDVDGVVECAQKNKVDIIYTTGSDYGIVTSAKASEILGLPTFVNSNTAEIMHNKPLARAFMNDNELGFVNYTVSKLGDTITWKSFPAMMKPSDSQGQRGVLYVNSVQDIKLNIGKSCCFSSDNTVIIEEFLRGPELSVETLVIGGEIAFVGISDRITMSENSGELKKHIFPSKACVSKRNKRAVLQIVTKCINAFRIQNGPVYFQMKLTLEGVKIIELTPRLSGGHLSKLTKMSTGFDVLDATFKLLIGDDNNLLDSLDQHALYDNMSKDASGQKPLHVEFIFENGERVGHNIFEEE